MRVVGDRVEATRAARGSGASEKVLFVGVDRAKGEWVGTASGVRFLSADGADVHFGRSDGLPTEDMDQNAFLADPDGTVWFGTSRGLVHARPGIDPPPAPPPIVLTGTWGGPRRLDLAAPATLHRDERTIRISWVGLTLVDPQKVRITGTGSAASTTPTSRPTLAKCAFRRSRAGDTGSR